MGRVGKKASAYGAARIGPSPARERVSGLRKSAVHRFATGGKMIATVPQFDGPGHKESVAIAARFRPTGLAWEPDKWVSSIQEL